MPYLMTWWGTVVCRDSASGPLVHRPLSALDGSRPATLFEIAAEAAGEPEADGDGSLTIGGEHALYAAPDGRISRIDRSDRLERGASRTPEQARFVKVTASDLETLRFITNHRWVRVFSRTVVRAAMIEGCCLRLGDQTFPLAGNLSLPFWTGDRPECPHRFTVYRDTWKIDDFVLFNPLVVAVVFGRDEILGMLEVLLHSLDAIGQYDGDLLIRGDRGYADFEPFVPAAMRARTHVENRGTLDRMAWRLARYALNEWPRAREYQPIMYIDADVAVDRPIQDVLVDVVLADAVCVQEESFTRVGEDASVGADLCAADDSLQPGSRQGFNAGVMGVPSLQEHGRYLATVQETIRRFYLGKDLNHFGYVDQPVANYVAMKSAPVNVQVLTRYIRHTHFHVLRGASEPQGFVHFWGSGRPPRRLLAMRDYVTERLRAIEASTPPSQSSSATASPPPSPSPSTSTSSRVGVM